MRDKERDKHRRERKGEVKMGKKGRKVEGRAEKIREG